MELESKMTEYCCDKFKNIINTPESAYYRQTTFKQEEGVWYTDFSDGEYGDIKLTFCPFCGKKL